jgi:hypothetical protein
MGKTSDRLIKTWTLEVCNTANIHFNVKFSSENKCEELDVRLISLLRMCSFFVCSLIGSRITLSDQYSCSMWLHCRELTFRNPLRTKQLFENIRSMFCSRGALEGKYASDENDSACTLQTLGLWKYFGTGVLPIISDYGSSLMCLWIWLSQ